MLGALSNLESNVKSPAKASTPAVYIKHYSIESKILKVTIAVAKDATGSVKIKLTNPSGKSGMTKKALKINGQ